MSLTGMPLTAAYLSKEGILSALPGYAVTAWFAGSLLTLLYTARLLWYLKPFGNGTDRTDRRAFIPVMILSGLSLWPTVAPSPLSSVLWNGIELPHNGMLAIAGTAWVIVIATALWFTRNGEWIPAIERHTGFIDTDPVSRKLILTPVSALARWTAFTDKNIIDRLLHGFGYFTVALARITQWFDRHLVDGIVTLTARIATWTGSVIRRTAAGDVQGYLWWTALGLVILLTCLS